MQDDFTKLCECGCGNPTPPASITNKKRGWIKGEPIRFIHGHSGGGKTRLRVRIQSRGYSTPCWIWRSGPDTDGYGRVKVAGRRYQAHRVLYEASGFTIPEGYVLDHRCRVRLCVNPAHLDPITNAENRRRSSRLTREDVAAIRESDKKGTEIAAEYGISCSYVTNIRKNKRLVQHKDE